MKADEKVTVEEKLGLVRFKHGKESHLSVIAEDVCVRCEGKWCTTICPAHVYEWSPEQNKVIVNWENCLETGACITGCPYANIQFQYPKGGKGVEFRYG
ncbi:4Fe-4S dicluster domain-containing protein [Candidatus Woesearchaeota archaeon]|nr:4Fe-4S dicluster domain-containing protein [Candidatus Woesearchaeota archaeon]